MFAYKFGAVFAGTVLGIAVVAVGWAHAPTADMEDGKILAVTKSGLVDNQRGAKCPKSPWPYGCEWRPSVALATKHILVQRRGHHFRLAE